MRRRDGPAHLDQIALIKQRLSIPVITNGNVRNAVELVQSLQITGADGAMTAEGALDDPAIFAKAVAHVDAERVRLKAEVKQGKALKVAKRDEGRKLTKEENAALRSRKEAKARLKQLLQLRRPLHSRLLFRCRRSRSPRAPMPTLTPTPPM